MFKVEIKRDGKTYELTGQEIAQAREAHQKNWYLSELKSTYGITSEMCAGSIANLAYDIYSRGDGETEYEALEKAIQELT